MSIALSECAEGDEVFVDAWDDDTPISARLRALGVMAGVPMRVARSGSPMIIEVGESRLCLRADEVAHIRVIRLDAAWPATAVVEDASPA
jgi:Fe2+ transport system protein FeoA